MFLPPVLAITATKNKLQNLAEYDILLFLQSLSLHFCR